MTKKEQPKPKQDDKNHEWPKPPHGYPDFFGENSKVKLGNSKKAQEGEPRPWLGHRLNQSLSEESDQNWHDDKTSDVPTCSRNDYQFSLRNPTRLIQFSVDFQSVFSCVFAANDQLVSQSGASNGRH